MARSRYEDDEEDERPRRSKRDEDDEDEKPRKKKAARDDDDDDDEPVKKKRKVVDDDDEDDDPPKKKSRSRDDDDDDKPKKREYVKRDASDIKRHAEQRTGGFDSIADQKYTTFTPKDGTNVIRFLPSTYGDKKNYVFEFYAHYRIGADKGTYVCPEKMLGKPCPICEERTSTKDEEVAKLLRPQKRYIAWVINRDAERDGPILWNLSPSQDKEISSLCLDRHGRVILIDDPDEGYDVEFKREGKELSTRYFGWKVERDPSPISDNEKRQDKWYDFIEENPLDELLIIHDYEYLAKVFAGQVEKKDELDDDDDAPRSSRSKRSSSRSMREELDDEIPERGSAKSKRERLKDDDDEEPVRKKKKVVDEDDEDDDPPRKKKRVVEDDDDEEEEERPRKKKKPVEDDDDDEEDVSEKTKSKLKEMGARRSGRR